MPWGRISCAGLSPAGEFDAGEHRAGLQLGGFRPEPVSEVPESRAFVE